MVQRYTDQAPSRQYTKVSLPSRMASLGRAWNFWSRAASFPSDSLKIETRLGGAWGDNVRAPFQLIRIRRHANLGA
jgi:hypothetical protein